MDKPESSCAMCHSLIDLLEKEFEGYMRVGNVGLLCDTCVSSIVSVAKSEGMVS